MYILNKNLLAPVQYLKGVGPHLSKILAKKSITSVMDTLYFFPRTYEDRRKIKKIIDINPGCREIFIGKIISIDELMTRISRKKVFTIKVSDHTGSVNLKWFKNSSYFKKIFQLGQTILVSGLIKQFGFELDSYHPDIEILNSDEKESIENSHLKGIIPIYSETTGLTQKTIRKIIKQVIEDRLELVDDFVPEYIIKNHNMQSIHNALRTIHNPPLDDDFNRYQTFSSRGHLRLIFNEFFLLEMIMGLRKNKIKRENGIAFNFSGTLRNSFISSLPFELTKDQLDVCNEIEKDQLSLKPMNRLLQGDVGSGKTLVALISSLNAIEGGYQVALMAPTEILATQHFINAKKMFDNLNIKVALLVSGMNSSDKKNSLLNIQDGSAKLIIGTHALIQQYVEYKKLGFAIIDEQHRFGVKQRQTLIEKAGQNIDILIMTATPIPRTLALTVYGDLDVSTIRELPPGREPIETILFYERKRKTLYELISSTVNKKEQAYIVYPLVRESEKLDLKDATNMYEKIKTEIFPKYKIGLIHGKLHQNEKGTIMQNFKNGKIDILISTTVIEVGVDVPNATLMVIEHAERFGLSQLHQLRGRVGRGSLKSACALMTNFRHSEIAEKRLEILSETNDGFKIAEHDLELRGPGEFLGTRQSGLPGFKIANIIRDQAILFFAKKKATEVILKDPNLILPEHEKLKEIIELEQKRVLWN